MPVSTEMRIFNPEPKPGLKESNFRKICQNGFGDLNNCYAHAIAWFKDHLYVGTSRANLCLIKAGMPHVKIGVWPVECPYPVYSPEFEQNQARGEIWRYSPVLEQWERVHQAPMVVGSEGDEISRELGYRAMVVFQGESDTEPVLYLANWSRSRGEGALILRSEDGKNFLPVSQPGLIGLKFTSTRLLVPFKGKLFTAPTGSAGGKHNISGVPFICESRDPAKGEWQIVNEPGFGDPSNQAIFELVGFGDYLYAGTANNNGFQIWRTLAEGEPPYEWTKVISDGAGRGSLNQITVSMVVFNDALYVGTGIQGGGYDQQNKIGPAAAEIIRLHHDGSWELIVGNPREGKQHLSGFYPGFNNYFGGYIWKMSIHDGWLYAGTMDWTIFLRYTNFEGKTQRLFSFLKRVGIENIIEHQGGFDLWRTYDGENWLPVTRQGFQNPYNYGVRNIVSTPHGVFIGTANPFGPKVATKVSDEWEWAYTDNPNSGLEVWQGK